MAFQPLSHSVTQSGWVAALANLPQPLSHSATLPEWLDQSLSHSAREAGPASLAEWLSGWVAASISRAVLHIHSNYIPSIFNVSTMSIVKLKILEDG